MTAQISIDVYHQLFIKSRTAIELRFAVRSQFRMPIMSGGGFYPKESSPGAHLLTGCTLNRIFFPVEVMGLAYASEKKNPPPLFRISELRSNCEIAVQKCSKKFTPPIWRFLNNICRPSVHLLHFILACHPSLGHKHFLKVIKTYRNSLRINYSCYRLNCSFYSNY